MNNLIYNYSISNFVKNQKLEVNQNMFNGKVSILKNITYLSLLGIHTFLFLYFLYITFVNFTIIIISSLSIVTLITVAFYSFLTSKSYYYYFYIGIIICSFPIIAIVYLSAILIVPELVILLILSVNGVDDATIFQERRLNKQANLFQHDPAVAGMLNRNPSALSLRMEEVWNPNGTVPMLDTNVSLDKTKLKMQIVTFLLTIIYFSCSVISVYLYILSIE